MRIELTAFGGHPITFTGHLSSFHVFCCSLKETSLSLVLKLFFTILSGLYILHKNEIHSHSLLLPHRSIVRLDIYWARVLGRSSYIFNLICCPLFLFFLVYDKNFKTSAQTKYTDLYIRWDGPYVGGKKLE